MRIFFFFLLKHRWYSQVIEMFWSETHTLRTTAIFKGAFSSVYLTIKYTPSFVQIWKTKLTLLQFICSIKIYDYFRVTLCIKLLGRNKVVFYSEKNFQLHNSYSDFFQTEQCSNPVFLRWLLFCSIAFSYSMVYLQIYGTVLKYSL